MRSLRFAVPLLLLAGCSTATAGSGSGASSAMITERESRAVSVGTGDGRTLSAAATTGAQVTRTTIAAPAQAVFAKLPEVFRGLGLEVNVGDRRGLFLGVENLRLRRIGNDRPSRYLNCGQGAAGANADSYDIYLTFVAQVRPAEAGSSHTDVHVEAMARRGDNGGSTIGCASTGLLEAYVAEVLGSVVDA